MKTKVIFIITMLIVICTGCKKHECAELSWTDYNTVEDVHCNFKYCVDENKAHIGDTLKVFGWLFETHEYHPDWQYLTNNKELQFCNDMGQLSKSPHISLFLPNENLDSIMPINPYDSLLYVKGIVMFDPEVGGNGSFFLETHKIEKK